MNLAQHGCEIICLDFYIEPFKRPEKINWFILLRCSVRDSTNRETSRVLARLSQDDNEPTSEESSDESSQEIYLDALEHDDSFESQDRSSSEQVHVVSNLSRSRETRPMSSLKSQNRGSLRSFIGSISTHSSLKSLFNGNRLISFFHRVANAKSLERIESKKFSGHKDSVICMKIYPKGGNNDSSSMLVSGSRDGTIRTWNLNTFSKVKLFDKIKINNKKKKFYMI